MNIYSEPGTAVVFAYPTNGYKNEQEIASKYLKEGEVYTVAYTDVHQSSTDVYLTEFPAVRFNSVMFADYVDTALKPVSAKHTGNMVLIERGALRLAINVFRRAGKNEVADELENSIIDIKISA